MFEMSKVKAFLLIGACLLGTLFLANTPDEVPTGQNAVEAQILNQNHQAYLDEMKAKEERLRNNVTNIMAEHEAMTSNIRKERAEIEARSNQRGKEIEAHRAEILAKQAEIEAKWGTVKPHLD